MKDRTGLVVGGFLAYWVFTVLAGLALTAGAIYVAIHFISKFW